MGDVKRGLGGWLILVGIGLVISTLATFAQVAVLYIVPYFDGSYAMLTNQGSPDYVPGLALMFWFEALVNLTLGFCYLGTTVLFFMKRRLFPMAFIGLAATYPFWLLLDSFLVSRVFPDTPVFDPDTVKALFQTIIYALIWIPYMLRSRRVEATFVN